MGKFEESMVGSTGDNVWSEVNNFAVGDGLVMMAINCVWICVLGLYLEQVMPKTYGKSRNVCFFLQPSYWGCCRKTRVA